MLEKIGIDAGKVWSVLDESGEQSIKELRKASGLIYNDIYAALGWLAREGKIVLENKNDELYITLV